MKNTKNLLMLVCLLFAGFTTMAQIEVTLGTGFHSGAFKMTGPDATLTTGSNSEPEVENIYYSLGGGIPVNLGIGIPIGDNLTFNADFCYWLGTETTTMEVDQTDDIGGGNTLTTTETLKVKSNQIRFMPGLTFKAENGLYARTSLVLPLGGKTTFTSSMEQVNSNGNTTFANAEGESTGNFSLGAAFAFGYAIELADNMMLGLELQSLALNIKSATRTLTSYEDNNGTTADDFPTVAKESNYVDAIDNNSNTPANPDFDIDKPMDELAGITSFGAWGFNVRFIYIIGG